MEASLTWERKEKERTSFIFNFLSAWKRRRTVKKILKRGVCPIRQASEKSVRIEIFVCLSEIALPNRSGGYFCTLIIFSLAEDAANNRRRRRRPIKSPSPLCRCCRFLVFGMERENWFSLFYPHLSKDKKKSLPDPGNHENTRYTFFSFDPISRTSFFRHH